MLPCCAWPRGAGEGRRGWPEGSDMASTLSDQDPAFCLRQSRRSFAGSTWQTISRQDREQRSKLRLWTRKVGERVAVKRLEKRLQGILHRLAQNAFRPDGAGRIDRVEAGDECEVRLRPAHHVAEDDRLGGTCEA